MQIPSFHKKNETRGCHVWKIPLMNNCIYTYIGRSAKIRKLFEWAFIKNCIISNYNVELLLDDRVEYKFI